MKGEWYRRFPQGNIRTFEQMCQEFTEQFRGAMALEDDMMELTSMKQGENETLRDFIKRYHRAILDLGAFNHPQGTKGRSKDKESVVLLKESSSSVIFCGL